MHVFVPMIPDSMKNSLEAPFPYIIGIETQYFVKEEVPDDILIVFIDEGRISSNFEIPKLPTKDLKNLKEKLKWATQGIKRVSEEVNAKIL